MSDYIAFQVGNFVSVIHYSEGRQPIIKISRIDGDKIFLDGDETKFYIERDIRALIPTGENLLFFGFSRFWIEPKDPDIYYKDFNQENFKGRVEIDITSALARVTVTTSLESMTYHWHWISEMQNGMKVLYDVEVMS